MIFMSKRSFSDKVFLTLQNQLARLDKLKTVDHLISCTDTDFTRKRKLSFTDIMMIILSMEDPYGEAPCVGMLHS